MSQWYEDSFEVDGVTYLTAEMWMMIQKARLFGDEVRVVNVKMKGSERAPLTCSNRRLPRR